jgi:hypothetical protein
MCPGSSARIAASARPARWPRLLLRLVTTLGILLAGRAGRAADIAVLDSDSNAVASGRTLRLPATGEIALDKSGNGYVTVGLALSDVDNEGFDLILVMNNGNVATSATLVMTRRTLRAVSLGGLSCRSELWAGTPVTGATSAHVDVKVRPIAGNPPAPSVSGTIVSFSNVASSSIGGPCCVDSANSGEGMSTISKTMTGTSRGDALFNSVCTKWPAGVAPTLPAPDPVNDPEMVPRSLLSTAGGMQHFAGTSPGADVLRPAVSHRTLRWLQSGSRVWGLTGLMLLATDTPNVPDAGTPGPDMAPPLADAGPAAPPDTSPPADVAVPPDVARVDTPSSPVDARPDSNTDTVISPPPDALGVSDAASPPPDARLPDADADADASASAGPFAWRVGCACELGSPRGAPAGAPAVILALLVLLALRRARRDR